MRVTMLLVAELTMLRMKTMLRTACTQAQPNLKTCLRDRARIPPRLLVHIVPAGMQSILTSQALAENDRASRLRRNFSLAGSQIYLLGKLYTLLDQLDLDTALSDTYCSLVATHSRPSWNKFLFRTACIHSCPCCRRHNPQRVLPKNCWLQRLETHFAAQQSRGRGSQWF